MAVTGLTPHAEMKIRALNPNILVRAQLITRREGQSREVLERLAGEPVVNAHTGSPPAALWRPLREARAVNAPAQRSDTA